MSTTPSPDFPDAGGMPEIAPVRQVNHFGEQERMILEAIDIDKLAQRVGGVFRATSLVQKRLREIVRLVPEANRFDNKHLIANVLEEIEKDVIEFEQSANSETDMVAGAMFGDE